MKTFELCTDKKTNKSIKFYFRCSECNYLFYGEIGTKCPNCGSIDVRIITAYKLLKYFTGFSK